MQGFLVGAGPARDDEGGRSDGPGSAYYDPDSSGDEIWERLTQGGP